MRFSPRPQTSRLLSPQSTVRSRWMLVTSIFTVLSAAGSGLAQGPRVISVNGQPPERRAVLVDIEEETRQQDPNHGGNQFQLTVEQLDYWIFNNSFEMAHENHQALIVLEIAQLDAACDLSAEQKQLLQLAGAGELQRQADIRTVLQARYAGRTYDQNKVGEVYQELQRYQSLLHRRSLDSKSYLLKLLPSILDPSQTARFEAWQEQRHRAEYRAQIVGAIADIEKQIPLTITQRERLFELFETQTRPVSAAAAAQHINPSVGRMAQLNDVPADAFQAFLQPPQWEILQTIFGAWRGYARVLREQNLLLDPLPPPAQRDAAEDAGEPHNAPREQETPQ